MTTNSHLKQREYFNRLPYAKILLSILFVLFLIPLVNALPNESVVVYMPFNESSGDLIDQNPFNYGRFNFTEFGTVDDADGYDGTPSGAREWTTRSTANHFEYDGVTVYPNKRDFVTPLLQENAFTRCMWVNVTDTSSGQNTLFVTSNSVPFNGFPSRTNGGTNFQYADAVNHNSVSTFTVNQWNHLCHVIDHRSGSSSKKTYFNGVLDKTDFDVYNGSNADTRVYFGVHHDETNHAFQGVLDEFVLFNDTLSDGNISYIYNNGVNAFLNTYLTPPLNPPDVPVLTLPADNDHVNSNQTLSWGSTTGANNYTVYHSFNVSNPIDAVASCTQTPSLTCDVLATSGDGVYYWKVQANNDDGQTNSTTRSYVYDSINPDITVIGEFLTDNSSIFNKDLINLNVTFDDTYLFQSNVTVSDPSGDVVYSDVQLNLNSTLFAINEELDVTLNEDGIYNVFLQVTDDNTQKKIKNYGIIHDENNKKLRYVTTELNDISISVCTIDKVDVNDFSTSKEFDRYTWEYNYKSNKPRLCYIVTADKPLHYSMNRGYPLFNIWNPETNSGNWIDFNVGIPQEDYTVTKMSDKQFKIEVDTKNKADKKNFRFKSLGGTNTQTETYSFTVDRNAPIFSAVSVNNQTQAGQTATFSVQVNDTVQLNSYTFSSNETGTFINKSPISVSGTTQNINSDVIAPNTDGLIFCGLFYADDTALNIGQSNEGCTTVTVAEDETFNAPLASVLGLAVMIFIFGSIITVIRNDSLDMKEKIITAFIVLAVAAALGVLIAGLV